MELRDPGNTSLGIAQAGAAGETVILQTAPVAQSGTYAIDLVNLAGSGVYEAQLYLNARLEVETHGGAPNNSVTDAEDLDDSAIALGTSGGERMAVVDAPIVPSRELPTTSPFIWTRVSSRPWYSLPRRALRRSCNCATLLTSCWRTHDPMPRTWADTSRRFVRPPKGSTSRESRVPRM